MEHFGEVFTTSGLVLNDNIKWVTFHGSYDFAYFIKALSNQPLPEDENVFNEMLTIYFCNFYDARQMIKNVTWLKGSLSRISSDLDIKRIGQTHQAGSDSLVTSKVFFKLLSNFHDHVDIFNNRNKLFGFSYKALDEFEWNPYGNNFSNFNGMPFMGVQHGVNMNLNNGNNTAQVQMNKLPVNPNASSKAPTQTPSNMIYYQNVNGYNYQVNGMSSMGSMGSMGPIGNMNTMNTMGNMNSMNSMGNINTMNMFYGNNNLNGYSAMYQGMDYNNYLNGFYNGATTTSYKQPTNIGAKDAKFVPQN